MEPRLFVGSSVDSLDVAYAIQENLDYDAQIRVWPQGVFDPSRSAVESLLSALTRMDFGIFVFTPDDVANIRGEDKRVTRDNVLFELGLFVGKLGRERSFIFVPRECEDLHLPTDLLGMTPVTYSVPNSDVDFQSATGAACNRVRKAIRNLGPVAPAGSVPSTPQRATEAAEQEASEDETVSTAMDRTEETDNTSWLQNLSDGEGEQAIETLEKEIADADDEHSRRIYRTRIGRVKARIDLDRGLQYLEGLIAEDPESYYWYLGISSLYEEHDFYDDALAVLDRGLMSATIKHHLQASKAAILAMAGNKEEAQNTLERVVDEHPDYAWARVRLAEILIETDQIDKAKEVYQSGLKNSTNDNYLLNSYAGVLFELGEYGAALAVYNKLHKVQPSNAGHLCRLANAYHMLKLDGLALEAYERATELSGETPEWILSNLGNFYANKGLHPKAIDILNRALKQDSEYAFAHSRLSSAIEQNNEEQRRASEIISSQGLRREYESPPDA